MSRDAVHSSKKWKRSKNSGIGTIHLKIVRDCLENLNWDSTLSLTTTAQKLSLPSTHQYNIHSLKLWPLRALGMESAEEMVVTGKGIAEEKGSIKVSFRI